MKKHVLFHCLLISTATTFAGQASLDQLLQDLTDLQKEANTFIAVGGALVTASPTTVTLTPPLPGGVIPTPPLGAPPALGVIPTPPLGAPPAPGTGVSGAPKDLASQLAAAKAEVARLEKLIAAAGGPPAAIQVPIKTKKQNGDGSGDLLAAIRGGAKLKTAKTIDKSAPMIAGTAAGGGTEPAAAKGNLMMAAIQAKAAKPKTYPALNKKRDTITFKIADDHDKDNLSGGLITEDTIEKKRNSFKVLKLTTEVTFTLLPGYDWVGEPYNLTVLKKAAAGPKRKGLKKPSNRKGGDGEAEEKVLSPEEKAAADAAAAQAAADAAAGGGGGGAAGPKRKGLKSGGADAAAAQAAANKLAEQQAQKEEITAALTLRRAAMADDLNDEDDDDGNGSSWSDED